MDTKKRLDKLTRMGLVFNGQSYVGHDKNRDINIHYTEILCDSDTQWELKLDKIKHEITRRNGKKTCIIKKNN